MANRLCVALTVFALWAGMASAQDAKTVLQSAAKAMGELGVKIPIIASTHNGLTEVAKGIDLSSMEGSFSAFSLLTSSAAG